MSAPAARTLAEIVEEGRRLEAACRTACDGESAFAIAKAADDLIAFYRRNWPALLAVAEAADKREDPLAAAAREALDVLTRLADSAYQWAGRDVPPGLVPEIDSAKARLAGVLND